MIQWFLMISLGLRGSLVLIGSCLSLLAWCGKDATVWGVDFLWI